MKHKFPLKERSLFSLYRWAVPGDAVYKALLASDIPQEKPEHLWHSGWWDGPLDGLCLLNGKKRWFKEVGDVYVVDRADPNDPDDIDYYSRSRLFVVLDMPDEVIAEEEYWHAYFRHDVWGDALPEGVTLRPEHQSSGKFYENSKASRAERELSTYPVLAWYCNFEAHEYVAEEDLPEDR